MPTLDVTDVLFDPDFCDFNLWVTRRVQTVDEDGIGSDSEVKKQFAGVVTVDRSLENRRMQAGQVISGAILIVTTERLTQGQTGCDADIVTYQGRDYRVTFVDPYTAYGAGFVQAHCELMPFDGELRLSNNTSTERGWLIPTSGDPDYDEALDRLLSQWMRNVSGLSAGMVRPRWQKEQPPLLPVETNWCAFGVIGWSGDDSPAFTRQTDDGSQLWRHETIECMASFYGPAGMVYASRFRDGISVPQNNAALNALGLSLGDYTGLTPFPELINQQWVRRYDMTVHLRRKVVREYGIKSLVEAPVTFFGD